ncbi:MAG: hypothetical protein K0Q51_583 [Rickettsiaceae bacterium]|jgi:hypothetical protein|nr:hypothetical protein [Rickettsiaceae bacterium]
MNLFIALRASQSIRVGGLIDFFRNFISATSLYVGLVLEFSYNYKSNKVLCSESSLNSLP